MGDVTGEGLQGTRLFLGAWPPSHPLKQRPEEHAKLLRKLRAYFPPPPPPHFGMASCVCIPLEQRPTSIWEIIHNILYHELRHVNQHTAARLCLFSHQRRCMMIFFFPN